MRDPSAAGDPLSARPERGSDIDLSAVFAAVRRRKARILVPTLIALVLSAIAVQIIPARYKSTASVFLQAQESSFTRPTVPQAAPDQQVIDEQAVTSQVQLMMSRDLAVEAIRKLGLVGNADFDPMATSAGPFWRVLMVLGLIKNPMDQPPEERVLDAYFDALSVYPIEKSRVIAIEFGARDPDLAARAANTIASLYLARQASAKRGESLGASEALSPQIDALRQKVSQAEAAVEEFRAKNGLFLAQNSATLSTQQLAEINTQLSAARAQQSDAQARAKLIRDLAKSGAGVDVSDVTNNDLMRRLVEQRVTLRAQLALESRTLLLAHPRIKELQAQLADLDGQFGREAQKTIRSLENDARIAGERVASLQAQLDLQKQQASTSNGQEVQLRALEREAKAQRDLLESYLARFREASARASFNELPADARVISQAVPSITPYFPKKLPIIVIATLVTGILSLAIVVAGELLSGRALLPPAPPVRQEPAGEALALPPDPPPPPPAPPAGPRPPVAEPALEPAPGRFWAMPATAAAAPAANETSEPLSATGTASGDPPGAAPPVVRPFADADPLAPVLPFVQAEPAPGALDALADRILAQGAAASPRSVLFTGSGTRRDVAEASARFARHLAEGGLRAVLVDLNFGATPEAAPGLGELLGGTASFVDVIARDPFSRLHLIPAGRSIAALPAPTVERGLSTVFEALSATYEVLVFDGGVVGGSDGGEPAWAPIAAACESALIVAVPGGDAAAAPARRVLTALGARDIDAVAAPDDGAEAAA